MTKENYSRIVENYIIEKEVELGSERYHRFLSKLKEKKLTCRDDVNQWLAGIKFLIKGERKR